MPVEAGYDGSSWSTWPGRDQCRRIQLVQRYRAEHGQDPDPQQARVTLLGMRGQGSTVDAVIGQPAALSEVSINQLSRVVTG